MSENETDKKILETLLRIENLLLKSEKLNPQHPLASHFADSARSNASKK